MLLILSVLTCAAANAQVYERIDADGQVHYSDRPGPDAQPVEVRPVQTISVTPPSPQTGTTPGGPDKATAAYVKFAVVSPTNDQEVRSNDGNVTIRLSLRPALMSDHAVSLTVSGEDGEQTQSTTAMAAALSNLSRGRHTVSAKVVDGKGNVLIEAKPVSFTVLRAAIRKSTR